MQIYNVWNYTIWWYFEGFASKLFEVYALMPKNIGHIKIKYGWGVFIKNWDNLLPNS